MSSRKKTRKRKKRSKLLKHFHKPKVSRHARYILLSFGAVTVLSAVMAALTHAMTLERFLDHLLAGVSDACMLRAFGLHED